jgi:hypothetical protein
MHSQYHHPDLMMDPGISVRMVPFSVSGEAGIAASRSILFAAITHLFAMERRYIRNE